MNLSRTISGSVAVALLALLLGSLTARAQYSIPRSVIASGGVVNSSGGGFAMGGTVGQPVIGWTNGSSYNLHQGFWFPLLSGQSGVDAPVAGMDGARNWPNPFSTSTTIYYSLSERSNVHLSVYNTAGERVRDLFNGSAEAGDQNVPWDGLNDMGERVGAGMYIFAIDAFGGNGRPILAARGKMVVIR